MQYRPSAARHRHATPTRHRELFPRNTGLGVRENGAAVELRRPHLHHLPSRVTCADVSMMIPASRLPPDSAGRKRRSKGTVRTPVQLEPYTTAPGFRARECGLARPRWSHDDRQIEQAGASAVAAAHPTSDLASSNRDHQIGLVFPCQHRASPPSPVRMTSKPSFSRL
jgi:hypothetical protein